MTNDDVLYAYRLRVLASARELGSVAAACRVHGIHRSTFYRWKKQYGRLEPDQARELKQLQEENARLKKLVADLSLDKAMLQEVVTKKL